MQQTGKLLAGSTIELPSNIYGSRIIAYLPFEHIGMYKNYGRIGTIIRQGSQCVCCKSKASHFVILNRGGGQQGFALYTDRWIELTIDHVTPRSMGGKDRPNNYQVLCKACNSIKGDRHITVTQLRSLIEGMFRNLATNRGELYPV